jgi:4-amino-4-deoxy-L-arabinose transferase-like glycosyltransferase
MSYFLRSRVVFSALLVVIALFAFALRNYHIGSVPAGLYPDEAMNGVDGIGANESGDYQVFYPNNNGREGLFINLQALAVKAFGNTVPALKLWSGIFGTLAVLGTGLLAWELFRRRSAALLAALLIATSYWAINFSRIGFRAIMVPFLLSFVFAFFFRGLRTGTFLPFALSGLLFGLGLNTYVAFRLAPLILILLLPFLFFSYEHFLKRFWKHAALFVLTASIGAAPMFYAFITTPDIFVSRSAAISIFAPEVNHGQFLATFAKTFALSLAKYNLFGDQNWRHNYPPYPILDPIVGILFLAGLLFSLGMTWKLLRRHFREKRYDPELAVHGLLLAGFFSMLAPEFLTEEGLPHALRSIGTQPFVFLLATIPLIFIWNRVLRAKGGRKIMFTSFFLLALGGSAIFNITKYFVFFAGNPNQHGAFNENYTLMADYLMALPTETHKYVFANGPGIIAGNGLPISAQPIVFLTHGKIENLEFLKPETLLLRPAVILPMQADGRIFANVKKRYPDASELTVDMNPGYGSDFTVIVLPGNN